MTNARRILVPLLAALSLAGVAALLAIQPKGGDGTYAIDGEETAFAYPFRAETDDDTAIEVRFQVDAGLLRASRYRVLVDDCLESLDINGEPVAADLPFCDYDKGRVLALPLRPGTNDVVATVRNHGGPASLGILVAWNDPLNAMFGTLAFAAAAWAVWTSGALRKLSFTGGMEAVFVLGAAARAAYAAVTPYSQRGYDVDGHIEYVRHVLDHWTVPAIADGWQFYQPPLYYMVAAVPAWLARSAGFSDAAGMLAVQLLSVALSCASLAAAGWIVAMAMPRKNQARDATLAYALFAVFPATVFLSARINNDVLLECAGLWCVAFLLRRHATGKDAWWHAGVVAFGAALLAKSNALLLAPFLAASWLAVPKNTVRRAARLAAAAVAVLAVTNGWYVALRAIEGQDKFIPNVSNLHSGLIVGTDWTDMAEFNPVRVSSQAYNNPWDDAFGRQHFWEYLFRSAFTGEFDFGPSLAPLFSALLAMGMALFAAALVGIAADARKPLSTFPLWTVPAALLLGHAAFRQFVAPYSSSQDFRYSILVLAPLAVLCARGIAGAPDWVRRAWRVLGWSFVALASIVHFSVAAV